MPTTNKLFGLADPQYDALRVFSAQSLEVTAGDGAVSTGGLENKIYLWPADGSPISTYAATQAGLVSALAAAVSGDTVWLPSIPIALTTGVTVPAGANLIGISDNAALSFSGFSGAAVTLSAGSSIFGFSITMVSNGVDAIGVNAVAAGSRAEHLTIVVSGGSTRNLRVLSGVNAQSTVVEMWSIYKDVTIAWAETTGQVGDSPTWHTIALPANFVESTHNEFAQSLQIDHLGHYLYVTGQDSGNGNRGTVWQLTNLAAIRATPATAPSWSVIAYSTQVVSAGTLLASTYIRCFYIRCFGDSLYLRAENSAGANTILGIYNGSSWTWRNGVGGDADKAYQAVYGGVYAALNLTAGSSYVRDWLTDAIIGSGFGQKFGIDHFSEIWRRFDAPNKYTHPIVKTGDTVWLHEDTTGTETSISNTGTNPQDEATVRGAYTSDAVYCVDAAGDLYVSSDSLAYSNVATWAKGWAMNTVIDGSGDLLWLIKSQTDTNPVVRLYSTAGSLLDDLTGDLWTVLGHPAGTILFRQLLLVYSEAAPATNLPIIADIHAGSATGTGAADVLIDGEAIILDADLDVIQVDSGTAYVRDVSYTTHNGAGAIEPQWGDRGVWDVANYPARHASDIDDATFDYHNDPAHLPLSSVLADGYFYIGDGTGTAVAVQMSGDGVLADTGALTVTGLQGNDVAATAPADGQALVWDAGANQWVPGAASHTIQDEGVALPTEPNLNFVGSGVIATDDAGNNATVVTIEGTFQVYNETQEADGTSTTYYLINTANPGTIRVYVNGIRQTATDDVAPTDIVNFVSAPAAGAVLMFDYEMEVV